MDTYYKGNYHQRNHQRQDYNRPPQLNPINPIPKLQQNEIGIRSDLRGPEIKNVVDRVIRMLVYRHFNTVTLKSRGNGVSKLISIVDILKNKVLGLYHYTKTYSTSYQNENDNKEIKLPCMDAILSLEEPKDKTYGFVPPKKLEDMDEKYIDPNDFENNNRRHFQPGFRGRGRGRGTRGNFRGTYRGSNNNQRGNFRGVPMRGRGGHQQEREHQNRGYQNYHNYRQQEDEDYPNFRNNAQYEEREQRGYNNNNRRVYRGRGGYERNNNNNYENRFENRNERGRGRGGFDRGSERGRGFDRGNRGRVVNRGRGGRE